MLNAAPTEVQAHKHCFLGVANIWLWYSLLVNSKLASLELRVFFLFLQTVKVAVFYSKPQRLDVYVNAQLVAPNNAQWNTNKNDYTLLKPAYPGIVISKNVNIANISFHLTSSI